MVLTTVQTAAFFVDDAQMEMPRATVTQMALEGITTVIDLVDFDEKYLQRITSNIRRLGGRIADPTHGVPTGLLLAPLHSYLALSRKRVWR